MKSTFGLLLIAAALSLMFPVISKGQIANFGTVQLFAGVPSGSCAAGQLAVNNSNGNLYTCNNGSWALVSAGAGTPCTATALALQFNNAGAFGCITEWTYTGGIVTASAAAKLDISAGGATAFKAPIGAGLIPTVSGNLGYDSTANKWVFGQNGSTVSFGLTSSACAANSFVSTPATGTAAAICTQPTWANLAVGTAASVATFPGGDLFSGGIDAQTGTSYTVLASDENKMLSFSNGAAIAVTLPQATVAGFTSGAVFHIQNLGAGTVTITPTTSTINGAATLALTTGQGVDLYSDGANYTAQKGIGSGLANPMTSLGDIIFENNTPAAARLAGPTTPSSVAQILISTPSGGVAQAPAWALPGVGGRTITTTDTVAATDRSTWLLFNGASAFTETLPQANSAGFTSNFSFCFSNIGAGVVTFTPTTSTIDGQASISIQRGQNGCITSLDNTNYVSRPTGNSHQISAITNFGATLAAQTVVGLVPAIGPLGEVQTLTSVVVQSTLGVGCGAGSNTVNVTWAFTAPGGTAKTVAGDTISISANGALDALGAGSTVQVAAKLGTAITYTTTSTLASAGCSTTPQYTVYAKVVN